MHVIIRKAGFLVGLTLCVMAECFCQVVTSTRNGVWTDPMVWDSGQVPTIGNASETIVNHDVVIPGIMVSIQNIVVNGRLALEAGAVVDLVPDALPDKKDLLVTGVLVLSDGATLNGTSVSNTAFESGARYIHLQGPLGFIPYATWDPNSTFEIVGFRSQGYINIAHSNSWTQNFGHVVYNCAQQSTAFVDLNGYLRNIAGNFVVQSTNNQTLRLSTTQNAVINIGGDLLVEGPSKIWFSTTSSNTIVNVQNDFRYQSTSSSISYLTTRGTVTLNISGSIEMNSPGRLNMASTSTDSTGTRQATIALATDLTMVAGMIVAPPVPGKGTIRFIGSGVQNVVASASGTSFQGNMDYIIESNSIVNLGTSALSNASGTLQVKGKLQVGSTDPAGAIQLTANGNLHIQGPRIYDIGASIEYNGVARQYIGNGHPDAAGVHLICSNPAGVSLLKDVIVNDFHVIGNVDTQTFSITMDGNLTVENGAALSPERVNLTGAIEQQISASGTIVKNLTINKSASAVNLMSPLRITGSLIIESGNTPLRSNGFLTLMSTSDDASGTACVGPLPVGSSISGDVTVQRHMAGEGRIYRYLSSPVQNATVADLQDDFPITGRFIDPSPVGVRSSPSFYYYDESVGDIQAGWLPYPTTGLASANGLQVGKGYAAFIRQASASTVWDLSGPLNQGDIELPVAFTPNGESSNGWNLVGNPYGCAIRWDESEPGRWTMENVSSVIAIRDNANVGGGTFIYYDQDDGDPNITGGQVAVGQSFWVRATQENPRLIIHEDAKTLGGAVFFRKESKRIPSFAIRLSKDSLSDVAYFKVRPQASPGLDNWDGVKLDNEKFDISFASADRKSMAIQAVGRMPCDTTIQIILKDLTPGIYQLHLTTKHDFSRYDYVLIDRFLNSKRSMIPGQPYELLVTKEAASYATDRLAVQLIERVPEGNVKVMGPTTLCGNESTSIDIDNVEEGIVYSVWDEGSRLLASERAASAGHLRIPLSSDSLTPGKHVLTLNARSLCYVTTLANKHSVEVDRLPQVYADSISICPRDSTTLTASSDRRDVTFTWFPDEQGTDTLAVGATYETPSLIKSQRYFVEAATPLGCVSARHAVKVNVIQVEPAKISVVQDSVLSSNYLFNNSWFLNGISVDGADGSTVSLINNGIYTLQVDTLGCTATDSFSYFMSKAPSEPHDFAVFPNPVTDKFSFILDQPDRIHSVDIFDGQGRLVLNSKNEGDAGDSFFVDVSSLMPGIYVARVSISSGGRVVRIVKDNKKQ